MLRNVYLEGELGARYGSVRRMKADNLVEVMGCLTANFEDFSEYYASCLEDDIVFAWKINDEIVEDPDKLFLTLEKGDIIITPVPVGEGKLKDALKVVAGILVMVFAPQLGVALLGSGKAGAALGTFFKIGGSWLFDNSLEDLLTEDPSTDQEDTSYLFQGSGQTINSTEPIPICYGRMRIPGRPVSFEVRNEERVIFN